MGTAVMIAKANEYQRELVTIALRDLPPDHELVSPAPSRELVKNLRERGQRHPIDVTNDGNTWFVMAGKRRIKAARKLNWETIEAFWYHDVPVIERYSWMSEDNKFRSGNDIQDAELIANLAAQGWMQDDICGLMTITRAEFFKLGGLMELEVELRDAAKQGLMSISTAHEAAKLPAYQRQPLVEKAARSEKITGSEVRKAATTANAAAWQAMAQAMPVMEAVEAVEMYVISDGHESFPGVYHCWKDAVAALNGHAAMGYGIYRLEKMG